MIILLRRHSYTFNWESDSSGITDSCSGCGRLHNAHPIVKINKVKNLTLIFWSVSLPHQDFIFCQKTSWASVFSLTYIWWDVYLHGKSHCCNDTFIDVQFTLLIAKNSYEEYKLILCCYNQYFLSYFVWNLHSNWWLFLRVMQEKKSGCFFWTQCTSYLSCDCMKL